MKNSVFRTMVTTFIVIVSSSIAIAENLVKYDEIEDAALHQDKFIDADSILASSVGIEFNEIKRTRFSHGGTMTLLHRVIADCPRMRQTIVRAQISKDGGAFQDIQIPGGALTLNFTDKNPKWNDAIKYVCNNGGSAK